MKRKDPVTRVKELVSGRSRQQGRHLETRRPKGTPPSENKQKKKGEKGFSLNKREKREEGSVNL